MSAADSLNGAATVVRTIPVQWSFRTSIPPSANSRYRNVPGLGRVKMAAARRWDEAAGWMIRSQPASFFPGHVSVTIRAGNPSRRRDLDNITKPILDALVANRVIVDDCNAYVRELHLSWDPTIEAEQVLVTVRAI